jgi:hypothetical protein
LTLAETSPWVEFERATGSSVDIRLTQLIADDGPLAIIAPVAMEVLARAQLRRTACTTASSPPSSGETLPTYDMDLHRVAGIVGVDMDQASHRD